MLGERVLVVDDDPALRSLLALICRRAGFDVDVAADGSQALHLIEKQNYLLVILDLQMPRVNGFDVVRHLRARPRRPSILVMTALPPAASTGLDGAVVQAVVRKPFDVDLLTSMLHELASAARAEWRSDAIPDRDDNVIEFRR